MTRRGVHGRVDWSPGDRTGGRGADRRSARRLNARLLTGAGLILLLLALAVAAPLVTTGQPLEHTGDVLAPPSRQHLLGTDQLGRDLWTRIVYGLRIDFMVATLSVLFPFLIGCLAGLVTTFRGGWPETVLMRLADIVNAFPNYVLIIAFVTIFGSGVVGLIGIFTLTGWMGFARLTRAQVLTLREREFVQAASLAGFSRARIVFRHVLPNVVVQPTLFAMSILALNIHALAALGYLGLGIPPPTPELGTIIAEGQAYLATHWHISTAAGLVLAAAGLGFSLLGDGLADYVRAR